MHQKCISSINPIQRRCLLQKGLRSASFLPDQTCLLLKILHKTSKASPIFYPGKQKVLKTCFWCLLGWDKVRCSLSFLSSRGVKRAVLWDLAPSRFRQGLYTNSNRNLSLIRAIHCRDEELLALFLKGFSLQALSRLLLQIGSHKRPLQKFIWHKLRY